MAAEPKYNADMIPQARAMAAVGGIDREIAEFFGVTERTISRWKIQHPEFAEALATGKEPADRRVEHSLYRKAVGYTFDAEKVFCNDGNVTRVPVVEHVPPDTTAAIFWLKNRMADQYRDKQEIRVGGNIDGLSETEIAVRLASIFAAVERRREGAQ